MNTTDDLKGFMSLKRSIHLQRFIELELLIFLLLGVTTYEVMPAYTGFRDFLTSATLQDSLFCYGETIHVRLEPLDGFGKITRIKYFENHTSVKIHESLE